MLLTGRVTLVHVSATLVDLTQRGLLGMEEVSAGSCTDWLLRDWRGQAGRGHVQDFEVTLLDRLFGGKPEIYLSELGEALIPAVSRFRAHLRRDGLRHGWLRRWHGGKLTPGGEQMLKRAYDFRRGLRKLAAEGDVETLTALAPYAMAFGLLASPVSLTDADDAGRDRSREIEVQWSQFDRFAQGWQAICAEYRGHSQDSGHSGHTTGYADYGGSHVGGFSHGGHTGH
jgi:hypothetical protein